MIDYNDVQQILDDDKAKAWELRELAASLLKELVDETKNKQQFERDWLECCDKLNEERKTHIELEEMLVKKLEASQAREKVLRDALESLVENIDRPPDSNCSCHICPPCSDCIDYGGLREVFEMVDMAISKSTDDTALKAALAAERERIAKHFEDRAYLGSGYQLAVEIRALGDAK